MIYVLELCHFILFRIIKVKDDPRKSIYDNHLAYFCVPEMCWLRF